MMKKNLLALSIALAASQASAIELFNANDTTFAIGGNIDATLSGSDADSGGDLGFNNDTDSMFSFDFTRRISGTAFTTEASAEWSISHSQSAPISTRLAYTGVNYEGKGQVMNLRVGSQWMPMYDISGVSDLPLANASSLAGEVIGGSRQDNALAYRYGMNLGRTSKMNLGVGYVGRQDNIDMFGFTYDVGSSYQFTFDYDVNDFMVGLGYSTGTFGASDMDMSSFVMSAKYGTYADGLYVSGEYLMNTFGNVDGTGMEFMVAYGANNLNLIVNYETYDLEQDEAIFTDLGLQAEYNITGQLIGYAGYSMDLRDEDKANSSYPYENKYLLGLRYTL